MSTVDHGLTLLTDVDKRIASIEKKIFEVSRYAGNSFTDSSLRDLNGEVKDGLSRIRALLLELEDVVDEVEEKSEDEGRNLRERIASISIKQENLRVQLRSANLKAKQNMEAIAKEQRRKLLEGGEEAVQLRRSLKTQADMAAASENVTGTLRRTRQIMAQEVERGIETLQVLDESNRTLSKSGVEYGSHTSLLGTASQLLTVLGRQDIQERIIVVLGSILFMMACGYVLWKRVPLLNKLTPVSWLSPLWAHPVPDLPPVVVESQFNDLPEQAATRTSDIGHLPGHVELQADLSHSHGSIQPSTCPTEDGMCKVNPHDEVITGNLQHK